MNFEFVKNYINENGDELISDTYTHYKKQRLNIMCGKCKNIFGMTFNHYKNSGRRCSKCKKEKKEAERLNINNLKPFLENNDKIVSNEYKGCNSKLKFKCGKCTEIFEKKLADYKNGNRCKCVIIENKKKEIIIKLNNKINNSDYSLLTKVSDITDLNTEIIYICLKCNKENNKKIIYFLNNKNNCSFCYIPRKYKKTFTYDFVKNKIKEGGDKLISKEYVRAKNKLDIKCHKCNQIYKMNYDDYRRGRRCFNCHGAKKMTIEQIRKIVENNGDTLITKEYINNKQKLSIKCGKCKENIFTNINNYQYSNNNSCKNCVNNKLRKERQHSIDYIRKFIKNIGDELVSNKYINNCQKIDIKCDKCNEIFVTNFANYKKGGRCQKCYVIVSRGEDRINKFLKDNNISFITQKRFKDCRNKKPLPFDFYVEERFLIEFQGLQHYKSTKIFGGVQAFNQRQLHDQIKENYCEENNIPLLIIPYFKLRYVEKVIIEYMNNLKLIEEIKTY